MTKEVFAKGVSKVVPILGGIVSGGLTVATYMPMAKKLKGYLQNEKLADVQMMKKVDESDIDETLETEGLEAEETKEEIQDILSDLDQEIDKANK